MKIRPLLIVAALLVMAVPAQASFESFISSLEKAPESQRAALVEKYLQSADVPVVEGSTAWFVYRDAAASSVSVAGDFNSWKAGSDMMEKVSGTDLFYMRREFEFNARLDYKFVVSGSRWILDPLNPDQVTGGFGPNSELAMPEYIQPAEIIFNPGIPHGELIEETFTSKILGNTRKIFFYTPPGYGEGDTWYYPVLFVHDGGEYISLAGMVNVADNLIASGEIEPLIIVFIDPVDRTGEYKAGEGFMRMIVEEIVPLVDARFTVDPRPAARGMMGASLGGLISIHMTWNNPRLFGFCASQSGAFMADYTDAVKIVEAGPPREINFYLDWGTYEPSIAFSNEEMREAILRGGHHLECKVYPEGHSWGSWRAHLDDILKAFTEGNRDADRE